MEPTQTPPPASMPNPAPMTSPAKKSPVAAIGIGIVLVLAAVAFYLYHSKKAAVSVTDAPSSTATSTAPADDTTTQTSTTDTPAPAVTAAAPTSASASDPDFGALVNTTLAFKTIVANKDVAGLEATSAQFGPVTADMKSELADPKLSGMIWGVFSAIFSGVDQVSLNSGLTCKFYEKTPGKTYDRAAVCHIATTLAPSPDVSAFITAGPATLKLTFSKLSGTWYLNPPTSDDITMSN